MRILVCDHYTPSALAYLKGQISCEIHHSNKRQPEEVELQGVEALLIRSRCLVNEKLLKTAPQLKYVVTATSGFDHIDFAACEARKIQVAYTPEANADSAAELTMALMLNLLRNITSSDKCVRQQRWKDSLSKSQQISGLHLGIVGLGRIGQKVAKRAQAFQMEVSAYDPYVGSKTFKDLSVQPLSLIEVLLSSDVISLHVPLTKETRYLINHQTLEHMNPEAYLINTARGELIDETELAVRMEKGFLKGAALDVFEKEPLPVDSRLRGLENILLSPHLGAYTEEAFEKASQLAVEELLSMTHNKESNSRLPLRSEWFNRWRETAFPA